MKPQEFDARDTDIIWAIAFAILVPLALAAFSVLAHGCAS